MNDGALAEAEVLVEGRMKEGKNGRVGDGKREEGRADDSSHLPAISTVPGFRPIRSVQTWERKTVTWLDMVRGEKG